MSARICAHFSDVIPVNFTFITIFKFSVQAKIFLAKGFSRPDSAEGGPSFWIERTLLIARIRR
jgi:hypothetical protein